MLCRSTKESPFSTASWTSTRSAGGIAAPGCARAACVAARWMSNADGMTDRLRNRCRNGATMVSPSLGGVGRSRIGCLLTAPPDCSSEGESDVRLANDAGREPGDSPGGLQPDAEPVGQGPHPDV